MHRRIVTVWLTILAGLSLAAQSGSAADEAPPELQERIEDEHVAGTDLWIYNDLDQARIEARLQDKPIFVTFRCVPCRDCAAFDAEVAQGKGAISQLAKEKFISIRQVEMKGVDLSQFQFDYDLNWAAMFINADGTVYARYGTQSAVGPDAYNSVEGLVATMERVLELHQRYPTNAAELRSKRGEPKAYQTPLEMPGLENKENYRSLTTRANCIHCHSIHDAEHAQAQASGEFSHDLLWRYPLPNNVGLTIDPSDGVTIKSVAKGSPADAAELKAGQAISHMNGQAIASIADMQWVLHNEPNRETSVAIKTASGGEHVITLDPGWKRTDFSWRGSMWSAPPRLSVWMPSLTDDQRAEQGIDDSQNALLVRWINRQRPSGQAAFEAGLRQGDVVMELGGKPVAATHAKMNMHLKLNYGIGQKLQLTAMRNGKRKEIEIELVE